MVIFTYAMYIDFGVNTSMVVDFIGMVRLPRLDYLLSNQDASEPLSASLD